MQGLARELDLSETAFLIPQGSSYRLRWFTPLTEVDLCGHATLAAAHVLWETGRLDRTLPAIFQTRSGELRAEFRNDRIWFDFPQLPAEPENFEALLQAALGLESRFVGKFGPKYLIEVESEEIVRSLQPDFIALLAMPGRAVAVTSRSSRPGIDFVSRYFAPWVGVNEDPVSGSAHCALAPFWAERLGKKRLHAHQFSSREGEIELELNGDRCLIGRQALTAH